MFIIPTLTQLHTPNIVYRRILKWFDTHGRKHLPWQQQPSPYQVWVSEIMLQQTQVATVIPYFNRFMEHFPTINHLASADIDEVLHLWTGLGYYARARNLHRTASIISVDYHGKWPKDIQLLNDLPGIGRSTAGAIASLGLGFRAPILDGNVKRVLTRLHKVKGWPGSQGVAATLWEISDHYTPKNRCHHYNQAMMDLGATLCTRAKPNCSSCPVKTLCMAYASKEQALYPERKPKKEKPVKQLYMLILTTPTKLWLEQRPPTGIWGGLWSFPEFSTKAALQNYCKLELGCPSPQLVWNKSKRHTFSHYHLDYTPVHLTLNHSPKSKVTGIKERNNGAWFNLNKSIKVGLAAPVAEQINALLTTNPLGI